MKKLSAFLLLIFIISSCQDPELNPTSVEKSQGDKSSGGGPKITPLAIIPPLGYHQWQGVGDKGEGAGVALADLNGNGILDIVFMANDPGSSLNQFRWYVGYDLGVDGEPTSVGTVQSTPGLGNSAQGGGIALGDIDKNGTLDILLMHYDIGSSTNEFRYKIGWNIDSQAWTDSWSGSIPVGGLGNDAFGANVALADLDANGTLDIALIHRDLNYQLRYKIGSNLSTSGTTTSWTTPASPSNFPNVAAAGSVGIGFYKLPGDASYRGVIASYDKHVDLNQQPYLYFNFTYTNGYMSTTGASTGWQPSFAANGPGGTIQEGAGLAFGDINRNGITDMVYMGYDGANGQNTFRYYIAFDMNDFGH